MRSENINHVRKGYLKPVSDNFFVDSINFIKKEELKEEKPNLCNVCDQSKASKDEQSRLKMEMFGQMSSIKRTRLQPGRRRRVKNLQVETRLKVDLKKEKPDQRRTNTNSKLNTGSRCTTIVKISNGNSSL